jgi:NAD(P)H-hydrate epimerase
MLIMPDDLEAAEGFLRDHGGRYQALAIGPGLGRDPKTVALVRSVVSSPPKGPLAAVVDADALYALGETERWWEKVGLPIVLTPHSGEMSRLCGLKRDEIEQDRPAVAQEWSKRWGQVLVLKGASTVVAAPGGEVRINPTGNPLLATAGTGDVLSGVIAAFLAGGMAPFDAATAAVYVHGLAADLAVDAYGDRGMLAGDLVEFIPRAIKRILHT